MKLFAKICVITLAFTALSCAQAALPTNVYGVGASYNNGASPEFAGTAFWATSLADGTYSFTLVDALPISNNQVATNVGTGIAQKLFTLGEVPVFAPTSAGLLYTGPNVGWYASTGVQFPIRLTGNWYFLPTIRVQHDSVGVAGYHPVFTALVAWGK